MPSAEFNIPNTKDCTHGGHPEALTRCLSPLKYSGSLDSYEQSDLTPVIGREFHGLQVTELLEAEDRVIRDLAVTSKSYNMQNNRKIEEMLTLSVQSPNVASSSFVIKTLHLSR